MADTATSLEGSLREGAAEQDSRLSPVSFAPGSHFPRGATWDGHGVNFSLFSESSEYIELCLFDSAGHNEQRIRVRERTNGAWHIYLPDIAPGQLYGYRVHGPYEPEMGLRFNPNKLLLDPYAKVIGRQLEWADELFGYKVGDPNADLAFDDRDSAPFAPLAAVADTGFDWSGEKRPSHQAHETIIYEAHVRGMTKLHPEVRQELRGTYAGMASEPVLNHLRQLGVTAIELMPVHYFLNDRHLADQGLRNYWGYNTLGFFAPELTYASNPGTPADVVREFKQMVKDLHTAGFEVILDVVYNHTAEGNHAGPTLSFRGIDNASYYRLQADQPQDHRHRAQRHDTAERDRRRAPRRGIGGTLRQRIDQPAREQRHEQVGRRRSQQSAGDDGRAGGLFKPVAEHKRNHHAYRRGTFVDLCGHDLIRLRVFRARRPHLNGRSGRPIGRTQASLKKIGNALGSLRWKLWSIGTSGPISAGENEPQRPDTASGIGIERGRAVCE